MKEILNDSGRRNVLHKLYEADFERTDGVKCSS
ncbi:hypothetical protein J2S19_003417 [Metabacillus malikii]|uniref:ArsR family transcriptional regulator n=1 Tax=Metabacillus malikii TaxID=1504265 RepID=A0ABT9ZLR2_9BACI|nr:hypothetical protein [Metabacillus malikii]